MQTRGARKILTGHSRAVLERTKKHKSNIFQHSNAVGYFLRMTVYWYSVFNCQTVKYSKRAILTELQIILKNCILRKKESLQRYLQNKFLYIHYRASTAMVEFIRLHHCSPPEGQDCKFRKVELGKCTCSS